LKQRQVHLDFHTSPYIGDVASEFDAGAFAKTFADAHVDSVTVFAKCHHGMCYYPTETGVQHPALKGRDLLGEQIEALHRSGIRCPIYTTVVWEEDVAQKHPQWRQLLRDGSFAQRTMGVDEITKQPGGWKFNNFLHPDYQDYIEAHVRELVERYGKEIDGLFFDIVFFYPGACWSDATMAFRRDRGFLADDPETFDRFESAAQVSFAGKFTGIVQGLLPSATLFYNSSNHPFVDGGVGMRARLEHNTHFEIESLPSGFWGYHHFPRMARQVDSMGKPWLGMTGRFQRMWGDFGGLKPQAALEYECFRTQALGGANSVGDQLPPRGTLDPAAYELIGRVYAQCEAADAFYAGSEAIHQVGIVSPHYPGEDKAASGKSEEAAVLMCDEAHYDTVVLDDRSSFDGLRLIILPDTVVITPLLQHKLREYYAGGGKMILSYRSGIDAAGDWALDFLPLRQMGEAERWPSYWRTSESFSPELALSDRVIYSRGLTAEPTAGSAAKMLIERVLPYFQRTDAHFSSHFQTPPTAAGSGEAAVLAGDRFIYFGDPVFREYRQTGNPAVRIAWRAAMARLIGASDYGDGLPSSIHLVPRRRGADLILTLLHYVPVRKALDVDVIDDRMSFAGERLRLPASVDSVSVFGTGENLQRDGSGLFLLPSAKGRLLLEVVEYFA
jgi:hypothetical protein